MKRWVSQSKIIVPKTCLLITAACFLTYDVYAEEKMTNITGSEEANIRLADYTQKAKKGDSNAHLYLGTVYCGELCSTPNSNSSELGRKILDERLKEIKSLGVKPDYVMAYAHFLLSDDFKTSYEGFRTMLAEHMTAEEISAANSLASDWKKQAK